MFVSIPLLLYGLTYTNEASAKRIGTLVGINLHSLYNRLLCMHPSLWIKFYSHMCTFVESVRHGFHQRMDNDCPQNIHDTERSIKETPPPATATLPRGNDLSTEPCHKTGTETVPLGVDASPVSETVS